MSYKVTIDEHGTAYPQFYCDVCREPIESLEEGNTIFSSKVPGNTSHVHKTCDQTRPHGYDNWHDLSNDVVWLLKRYGWLTKSGAATVKLKKAAEKATSALFQIFPKRCLKGNAHQIALEKVII